jgi:hypothetical protein
LAKWWGSGGRVPLILDLGTRWTWVVSFRPRQIRESSSQYPLDRMLCGHQIWSGVVCFLGHDTIMSSKALRQLFGNYVHSYFYFRTCVPLFTGLNLSTCSF